MHICNNYLLATGMLSGMSSTAQISFINLPGRPADNIFSIVTDPPQQMIFMQRQL